jgi:apolipoprotein D and lipocalin family protein
VHGKGRVATPWLQGGFPLHVRACAVTVALLGWGCAQEQPLGVAQVDLKRFEGGYFEIAKFPRLPQRDCTGTQSFYNFVSKDELAVVHECREGSLNGPLRRVAARAVVPDLEEPGKLSLNWILDVAADYRYAVVGHPSRDYLWILSRTAGMQREDLDACIRRANEDGFDVTRLEFTEQGAEASQTAPATPTDGVPQLERHGCSATPHTPASDAGSGLLAAALAALGVGSRRAQRTRR